VESDRPELRNNYAVALIRSGRMTEAEAQLETALRLHPEDQTAKDNLALLRKLLGR
jgi:Flp pilus assembly protein TadD